MSTRGECNPRWACYAWPLTIEQKWQADGQNNAGFIGWIGERWREWDRLMGNPNNTPRSRADHEAFDNWLEAKVGIVFDGEKARA
jgi:hypothetical protein